MFNSVIIMKLFLKILSNRFNFHSFFQNGLFNLFLSWVNSFYCISYNQQKKVANKSCAGFNWWLETTTQCDTKKLWDLIFRSSFSESFLI